MKNKILIFVFIFAACLSIDPGSKAWAENAETEAKELSDTIDKILGEIDINKLKQQSAELKQQLQSVQLLKAESEKKLEAIKEKQGLLETRLAVVEAREEKAAALEKKLENIIEEHARFSKENQLLKKEVGLFEKTLKEKNAQDSKKELSYQQRIETLSQKNLELKEELKQALNVKARLEDKGESSKAQLEKLKEYEETVKRLKENLGAENTSLKEKIQTLEEQNLTLISALQEGDFSGELKALEDRERALESKLKESEQYKEQVKILEEKIDNLTRDKAVLAEKNKQIKENRKTDSKPASSGQEQKQINKLQKEAFKLARESQKLIKENEHLKRKVAALENTFKKERSRLYEELGTIYTQAKLFGLAIESFNKSLETDPENSKIHYNLGLLYQHSQNNNKEALKHFRKSLKLTDSVKDKQEIEYLIDMLSH
ncbi:MAG: tetratricopeptide repeat protein [Candidatus Omnitrophica bacterium]|nr:tetratricopeptide repeat protein [Candidatus Omnitrophota bacterium]